MSEPYTESIFMDSGAHSLYNIHVLKSHLPKNKRPSVAWGNGDFSFYDLKRGSDFRKYCDTYAEYIKRHSHVPGMLFANVDVISHPGRTYKVQRFFEEEHGVQPVPIIHCKAGMEWVDQYLEAGKYDLLGVGGLGQGIAKETYIDWGGKFFNHICPESNDHLPVIKTHGFAMTSHTLMTKWPWWSVDSATWVKLSAYGWLYIPPWRDEEFKFDETPFNINFSWKSPQKKVAKKHYQSKSMPMDVRVSIDKWLEFLGMDIGSIELKEGEDPNGFDLVKDPEEILAGRDHAETSLSGHYRMRSIANLKYLKMLEASRPKWPWPLPEVERNPVEQGGFGL